MANSAQARKRARQNSVSRLRNHSQRSTVRTAIKKLEAVIAAGDKTAAQAIYRRSVSIIDKAAAKGLYHKNKAARLKSRLNERIKVI